MERTFAVLDHDVRTEEDELLPRHAAVARTRQAAAARLAVGAGAAHLPDPTAPGGLAPPARARPCPHCHSPCSTEPATCCNGSTKPPGAGSPVRCPPRTGTWPPPPARSSGFPCCSGESGPRPAGDSKGRTSRGSPTRTPPTAQPVGRRRRPLAPRAGQGGQHPRRFASCTPILNRAVEHGSNVCPGVRGFSQCLQVRDLSLIPAPACPGAPLSCGTRAEGLGASLTHSTPAMFTSETGRPSLMGGADAGLRDRSPGPHPLPRPRRCLRSRCGHRGCCRGVCRWRAPARRGCGSARREPRAQVGPPRPDALDQ